MWLMVMFDLPVQTKAEVKAANDFRHYLLDHGFEMCQFSVYAKFIGERDNAPSYVNRIKSALPANGKVSILNFTDKQFSEIINFENRKVTVPKKTPDQLVLL